MTCTGTDVFIVGDAYMPEYSKSWPLYITGSVNNTDTYGSVALMDNCPYFCVKVEDIPTTTTTTISPPPGPLNNSFGLMEPEWNGNEIQCTLPDMRLVLVKQDGELIAVCDTHNSKG